MICEGNLFNKVSITATGCHGTSSPSLKLQGWPLGPQETHAATDGSLSHCRVLNHPSICFKYAWPMQKKKVGITSWRKTYYVELQDLVQSKIPKPKSGSLMIFDDLWWSLMIFDDLWWSLDLPMHLPMIFWKWRLWHLCSPVQRVPPSPSGRRPWLWRRLLEHLSERVATGRYKMFTTFWAHYIRLLAEFWSKPAGDVSIVVRQSTWDEME